MSEVQVLTVAFDFAGAFPDVQGFSCPEPRAMVPALRAAGYEYLSIEGLHEHLDDLRLGDMGAHLCVEDDAEFLVDYYLALTTAWEGQSVGECYATLADATLELRSTVTDGSAELRIVTRPHYGRRPARTATLILPIERFFHGWRHAVWDLAKATGLTGGWTC